MKYTQLTVIILTLVQQSTAFAETSTDGTVGPVQILGTNNGHFTIGQDLGSLRGSNLFHSFKQFNINTGESATFTGNDTIKNVISRVTGGNESVINGLLQSKIGSADFYFINPAGIVFGENAQVDVPSAFHMSTAAELKFSDGASFNALNPDASTLTVAAPDGFGFAKGQNASLQIIGGQLSFKPGADVSLSANNIKISGVEQDNGEVKLAAITVDQADPTTEQGIHLNLKTTKFL